MLSLFLYPISLLPLQVLYLLSDFFYYLLYYVFKYRRNVVLSNLKRAFPHLSEDELVSVEKQFYKNFCDNFIEILKLQSISEDKLHKHVEADYTEFKKLIAQNKNIHLYLGHQFNWEWANAHISSVLKNTNIIVAYKPIKSKSFNEFMLKIRNRYGSKMVSSKNITKEMNEFLNKQHILILVADQNPKIPEKSFWTTFLSQKTAFISGSELKTASQKTPSYFANIIKIKRGHYKFTLTHLFDFSKPYKIGLITRLFAENLESAIVANPENYLWSHKRWKHHYNVRYKKRWIE